MKFWRILLAVVAGFVACTAIYMLGEFHFIPAIYPLPPGTDIHDHKKMEAILAAAPIGVWLLLLLNYITGAFVGGLVATLVVKRTIARPAVVLGIILTLLGIANDITIPQPMWFNIVTVLVYFPSAYLGFLSIRKKIIN